MKTRHHQFTKKDQIEIESSVHKTCGPLVCMTQWAGSMHFHFSMTPAQAREMADALLQHANHLDEPINDTASI